MAETLTYYGLARAHLSRMGPNVLPSVLTAIGLSSFDSERMPVSLWIAVTGPRIERLEQLYFEHSEEPTKNAGYFEPKTAVASLPLSLSLSLYIYIFVHRSRACLRSDLKIPFTSDAAPSVCGRYSNVLIDELFMRLSSPELLCWLYIPRKVISYRVDNR